MATWTPPSPATLWPIFNGIQWTIQNQSVSRNYVDTTFLMLSGGTMTGGINTININMSGNLISSGNITLSNAGSAITTSGSLKIPSSGLYINSIQMTASSTQLNYLSGVSITGTAVASSALVLDSSRNITNINSLSSTVLIGKLDATSANQSNITTLGSLTGLSMAGSISMNGFNVSLVNALSASGILALTNTSHATNNSNGAVQMNGGLSISDITDASSSTNGGSITTAGGVAIAKKLYVGSDINGSGSLTLTGTLTSQINATITNSTIATIEYPLQIQHLLSSGTPIVNSFGIGYKFQMPNASNTAVDYGAISCVAQTSTASLQQGQLNFYCSIGGSLVNAMTLSSLTSSTNNLLSINGATSALSVYNVLGTAGTFSDSLYITKASAPKLTITSSTTSTQSQLFFITDNQTWELGSRGSTAGLYPTIFYIYNGGFNMVMSPTGIITFVNSSVSTTSTSNAFQITGGLYTAKAILNNSYYNCNSINSAATSHATSPQALCLNDQAIYFRS